MGEGGGLLTQKNVRILYCFHIRKCVSLVSKAPKIPQRGGGLRAKTNVWKGRGVTKMTNDEHRGEGDTKSGNLSERTI